MQLIQLSYIGNLYTTSGVTPVVILWIGKQILVKKKKNEKKYNAPLIYIILEFPGNSVANSVVKPCQKLCSKQS